MRGAAEVVEVGERVHVADASTPSCQAEAEPPRMLRRWDAAAYLERDSEKARLAYRLLGWLSQSTVREYVSPKGYRMLIIDGRDP